MIALLVTFLTAVFILFSGINKQESQFKNITFILLLFGGSLALIESQGLINLNPFFGKILTGYLGKEPMLEYTLFRMMSVAIITFIAAFIIAIMPTTNRKGSDVLALMLFSLCGAQIMIGSNHLVMLFLGIEILSIPLYVLAGSDKENLFSNESALKYFIMGSFSTAILLLGSAFIYGGNFLIK
jgi:NADH-quinone oxidoreductase subunit N